MEPCKGGTLANLPEEAVQLMKSYAPEASSASWAFRFAASQEGVVRVLSGMNSIEQIQDNGALFKDFHPITEEELEIIWKVREIIERETGIPTFYFPTNGMHSYVQGVGMALAAVAEHMVEKGADMLLLILFMLKALLFLGVSCLIFPLLSRPQLLSKIFIL